jgi:hypothetical protein
MCLSCGCAAQKTPNLKPDPNPKQKAALDKLIEAVENHNFAGIIEASDEVRATEASDFAEKRLRKLQQKQAEKEDDEKHKHMIGMASPRASRDRSFRDLNRAAQNEGIEDDGAL